MDSDTNAESGVIRSVFAGDPDMAELIVDFVGSIQDRLDEMTAAFESGDSDSLRRISHQLKGAGGGYGFGQVSVAANDVEQMLVNGASLASGDLKAAFTELQRVCSSITAD